ncbi:MAG: TonB-dependent receptor [Parasphingorhabdus sp.]|uniref:TonB-dependent receptor n=1 Tax=Parasphingorhabdus sp. TaxID=2709688 RepID=UPI00329738F4
MIFAICECGLSTEPHQAAAYTLQGFEVSGRKVMKFHMRNATASKAALSLAMVSAMFASPAIAQDADSAEAEDPNIIIVTAQRSSQNIQDVPVSLTAVTADTLADRNINSASEIFLAAPTVQISGFNNNVSVRGIGTLAITPTVESSVGFAVDDVNVGRTALALGAFDDVERVEVLNGPQGLLFGKNSSAGLLNIVTRRPELGEFGGFASAELNLRDTTPDDGFGVVLRGTVNAPLGDKAALRINTRYTHQDGIVEDIGTGLSDNKKEDWGIRGKLLVEPSDNLEIYVIGEYAETNGTFLDSYRLADPAGRVVDQITAAGITAGPENLFIAQNARTFRETQISSIQGTIAYTLPNDWQIINVAAYKNLKINSNLDSDRTTGAYLDNNQIDSDFSQFSNELRLSIPDSNRVHGQLGLYYYQADETDDRLLGGFQNLPAPVRPGFPFCINPPVVSPGPPPNCNVSNDFFIGRDTSTDFTVKSYAAFGQLNFDVTDALTLIAGARVTRDKIDITSVQQQQFNYFVPIADPGTFVEEASNTNFSYKLGAQYDVNDDIMFYGYYATGYKGPAFNDVFVSTVPNQVAPETAETFELGFKSSFADNAVIFNLSAFLTKYDDYQAQSFNVNFNTFLLQNAGSLESKGIEAQLTLRPVEGLTISANASLLDSVYTEFLGAECYPAQPGCGPNNTFDASGQPLPASANFTSTIQGIYEFPVSDALDGFVSANWYHRSSLNFDVSNNPTTAIPTADYIGASIGVESEAVRVSLFCRNCFNQVRPTGVTIWAGDAAQRGVSSTFQNWDLNSVRNWGASVRVKF